MSPQLQRILESKRASRKQLSAKPVAEKLLIVECLAERALTIRKGARAGNGPSRRHGGPPGPAGP